MKLQNKLKNLGLFDFLIIIFVIFLAVGVGVFFFRGTRYIETTVKITEDSILYVRNNPQAWFVYLFKEGMRERDGLGRTSVEIGKVKFYDSGEAKKAVYLNLKLKANYNKRSQNYTYKGKPLLVGNPIKVELEGIIAEGLVTAIEGIPDTRKEVEIVVKSQVVDYNLIFPETIGIQPFLANAIRVDDRVKDSNGKEIIRILEKTEEAAKKIVTNDKGEVFLRRDPVKKDVYLTLKLLVKQINDEYYLFDDVQVKIDNRVPIHTSKYSIYPLVTEIIKTP